MYEIYRKIYIFPRTYPNGETSPRPELRLLKDSLPLSVLVKHHISTHAETFHIFLYEPRDSLYI
jgi:hypothetical protein